MSVLVDDVGEEDGCPVQKEVGMTKQIGSVPGKGEDEIDGAYLMGMWLMLLPAVFGPCPCPGCILCNTVGAIIDGMGIDDICKRSDQVREER